jgi:hypothetical protein
MLSIAAAILLAQAGSVQAAPAPPPPSCATEGHAQFDFFLGDWDVYRNGSDKLVAHSKWERLYNGCAVRENWMPLNGQDGGSLNSYDPATSTWHQTWIGSAGGRAEFDGGATGDKIVLTGWWAGSGPNGENGLTRMTYSRLDGGAVRQYGEFSGDHGLTWQPSFDLVYRPRKGG